MNTLIKFMASAASLLTPLAAFAQSDIVSPIFLNVKEALDIVVPITITLALIYFIWQVVQYVIAADEESKTDKRQKMLYGVIGLFVIIAIWGLVNFIGTYLGVSPTPSPIVVPIIP